MKVGVAVATLECWRSDALSKFVRERAWTAAARFDAVLTAAAMDQASRSAWCRAKAVYPQERVLAGERDAGTGRTLRCLVIPPLDRGCQK